MKRKFLSLILCLLLTLILVLPVSAGSPLVLDYANLMTSDDELDLEGQCAQFRGSHGLDVVILTVPSMMGTSAQDFADGFYENNGYSYDGLIFLLDMGSRQWHISTSGSAISALSDRDLEKIEDKIIPYLSEGRYYEGFCRFLDMLPGCLKTESDSQVNLFLSLVIGAAVAGLVLLIMRSSMNTKKAQRGAVNYENDGAYHLKTHQDLFLYSNISKRPRPQNTNSSGSTTHRSSSGRSHGGRGGSF